MRCLAATSLLVLSLPAFAQQNEAEKLYRAMEKKVHDAKGIKIGFEIETNDGKQSEKMHGSVTVVDGNRARMEATGNAGGKAQSITIVSDGKQVLQSHSDNPKGERTPVEPNLSQTRPQILTRGGVFASFQIGPAKQEFDIEKMMPLSEFKLGKKEKVGIRDAQPVEFIMKPDNGQIVQMTVWLDSQTNVPLKRVVVAQADKNVLRVTEVYTEITLNPKVDGKIFELPK